MYINFVFKENKYNNIAKWLLLITFLVGLMIFVGGLTRLTDSGLSITKWNLFSGILPPFSIEKWEKTFSLYKEIPEYYLKNSSMTLSEFKVIFWWEYAHRLLGRIIGIFYIVPLFYFTIKKKLKRNTLFSLYIILLLILLQGFVGWYMVVSGLTEKTDVSHYRLSLHLTLAFIIYIILFWNFLRYKYVNTSQSYSMLPKYILVFFLVIILIQISIGALVSGLDAGQIYNSWPLMNSSYYPDDSNLRILFSPQAFEIPSVVQFIHRNIAYFIFIFYLFILYTIVKNDKLKNLKGIALLIFVLLFIQILLGIFTILSGTNIVLASLHQMGSIFLVTAYLILIFRNSKIN